MVVYQAARGEDDVWIEAHDVGQGIPRIGESVSGVLNRLQYHVVDVIWRHRDEAVFVVLKKKILL